MSSPAELGKGTKNGIRAAETEYTDFTQFTAWKFRMSHTHARGGLIGSVHAIKEVE